VLTETWKLADPSMLTIAYMPPALLFLLLL